MQNLSSKQIREIFLNFFTQNDHKVINGASIIPKNDPTLLFINSGMAPMKKYFLAIEEPPYPRLSNVQPCIRTNDIEDVGDRHHLTFFEMMGSWSIGDYYKEKAIELAFDLLVNHFKFPIEKLYATVYKGDPQLNIPPDTESIRCWEKVGMPADHIVPLGEDNFWGPAGDTGPCGPCTEVFFDTGDEYGLKYTPGGHFDDANRYIEIWNAGVFMELNKNKDGSFSQLPMKSVDTGSGIERMYLALNKCNSLYDVDTILPIYNQVKNILGSDDVSERELRTVTDHMRTTTMLLGEGIIPDKEGRGYIARRLIRKSVAIVLRAGKQPSQLKEIVGEVINQMSVWYPDLKNSRANILNTLHQEITDFDPVIRLGLEMLTNKIAKLNSDLLPGDFIFELVATHGVPIEIVSDFATKKGLKLDEEGYQAEYRKHQEISRAGIKGKIRTVDNEDSGLELRKNIAQLEKTDFIGYKNTTGEAKVFRIIKEGIFVNEVSEGESCEIIFNKTPFYAESGGQVGDTGEGANQTSHLLITDTQKIKGVYLHSVTVEKGTVKTGDLLTLSVDVLRRKNITKNHTATHLLHASLRSILGEHVVQKGSLVNEHKLRFDFLHNKSLTDQELKEVELKINSWIWDNYSAKIKEMNYQDAINSGAMALFNENYGDEVRVVNFGNISIELCGGIHVESTGEIGALLITQENSAAKGIRRIEAITGIAAYNQIRESRDLLKSATSLLATTSENLIQTIKKIKSNKPKPGSVADNPAGPQYFTNEQTIELPQGIKVFTGRLDQDINLMQKAGEQKISDQHFDIVFIISGHEETGKAVVIVNNKVQETFKADVLIKNWLTPFGGRGGGKPALAKGGINDKSSIDEILQSVNKLFN